MIVVLINFWNTKAGKMENSLVNETALQTPLLCVICSIHKNLAPTERLRCDILKLLKEPLQRLTLQYPRP